MLGPVACKGVQQNGKTGFAKNYCFVEKRTICEINAYFGFVFLQKSARFSLPFANLIFARKIYKIPIKSFQNTKKMFG